MAIVKWEPRSEVGPVRSLRQEVDRLFDDFMQSFSPLRQGLMTRPMGWGFEPILQNFAPSIDLVETADQIVLTAELPGMSRENIDVTVTEDSVILRGERKEAREEKDVTCHYQESLYGAFERVIPMPAQVKTDKVEAKMKDGVLTLRLPKTQQAIERGRKIEVK